MTAGKKFCHGRNSERMNKTPKFSHYGLMLVSAALLSACTVIPTAPYVMALPGTGMSMERFKSDDMLCRDYAYMQIGGKSAESAARESAVTSAAVGTAIGALAGAAIGGNAQGAAVGAGTGLLFGSLVGTDAARTSGIGTQRQYDNAYIQCMYAKGHRVPVPANMSYSRPVQTSNPVIAPPPPPGSPPPPPPGLPPPPPPK